MTGEEIDFSPKSRQIPKCQTALVTIIFGLSIVYELEEGLDSLLHRDSPCSNSDSYHLSSRVSK